MVELLMSLQASKNVEGFKKDAPWFFQFASKEQLRASQKTYKSLRLGFIAACMVPPAVVDKPGPSSRACEKRWDSLLHLIYPGAPGA